MVLAIAFVVMLPLYWLISKRILYNIPIGEKIFVFKNDYAYISLHKFELLCHLLLAFPWQNIFNKNINHLYYIYLASYQKFKYFHKHIIKVCMPMYSLTYVQKCYVVIALVIIWY